MEVNRDPDIVRLFAAADQLRAGVRETLGNLDGAAVAEIVRTCARGELKDFDERISLLVGLLAVSALLNMLEPGAEEAGAQP